MLDFSRIIAGPLCAMLLADYGADVIKVEGATRFDDMRKLGTPTAGRSFSATFGTLNRNKRSVVVDLDTEAGQHLVRELISGADVLIENFRPGVAERLGIGYATCAELNPKLVYATVTGFGPVGPLAREGGYDMVAQAMSGIMSVTGPEGDVPYRAGVSLTDVAAGIYAALGVLLALREAGRSGRGQHVESNLLSAGLSFGVWEAAEFWTTGRSPERLGNAHRTLAPYQTLRARDGWFVLAGNTDAMFRRLCDLLGRADLASEDRFASNAARLAHREELAAAIESVTRSDSAEAWVQRLRLIGIPAGAVADYASVLESEHVRAADLVVHVTDIDGRSQPVLANPLRLDRTPARYDRYAPELGEHTDEVVAELGLAADERQH